jgi:hypothetical protein
MAFSSPAIHGVRAIKAENFYAGTANLHPTFTLTFEQWNGDVAEMDVFFAGITPESVARIADAINSTNAKVEESTDA